MTTSYELSLRLKELGVEQEGGLFYWVNTGAEYLPIPVLRYNSNIIFKENIICRAFTLGELVRELGEFTLERAISGYYATQNELRYVSTSTPEEAAGELLAEILSHEKQQA